MNQCLHCQKETKNPKYCNASCAAKQTNKNPKRKKLDRLCKICGDSNPTHFKADATMCYKCRNAKFGTMKADKRKLLKRLCLDYKGGKCIYCGYNRCLAAIHFHHKNPQSKDFNIAEYLGKQRKVELNDNIKTELDKCDVVCANCHYELHEAEKEGIEPSLAYSKTSPYSES